MEFVKYDFPSILNIYDISWSYFQKIIAVITNDGVVRFFDEFGEEFSNTQIQRNCHAVKLSWSPSFDALAIGWSDGIVSIFTTDVIHSEQIHEHKIKELLWHPSFAVLFSLDESGCVSFWDCDEQITLLFSTETDLKFDCCIFDNASLASVFLTSNENLYIIEDNQELDEEEEDNNDETDVNIKSIDALPGRIERLEYYTFGQKLIVITEDNSLYMYDITRNYAKNEPIRLTTGSLPIFFQIRADLICYIIDNTISIWNPVTDEVNNLRISDSHSIKSAHFDTMSSTLAVVTDDGAIQCWKSTMKNPLTKEGWENCKAIDLNIDDYKIYWSNSLFGFVGVTKNNKTTVVKSQRLFSFGTIAWQTSTVELTTASNNIIPINKQILNILSHENNLAVITHHKALFFSSRGDDNIIPLSSADVESDLVNIHTDCYYVCKGMSIIKKNFQGVTLNTTTCNSNSPIIHTSKSGSFMCVICEDYSIYTYDISRRQPKQLSITSFTAPYPNYRINSVSMSSNGFCLSIVVDVNNNGCYRPCPFLFLHSPQFDKTMTVAFGSSVPVRHTWDPEDPRLLVVEVHPYKSSLDVSGKREVVPMFVADSLNIFKQGSLEIPSDSFLSSVDIPRVFFGKHNDKPIVLNLPQFEGINNYDSSTKKSIMELNFHLAEGNVEMALNSIRSIDNPGTWNMLANTCIQIGRSDLVGLCLGKTGDAGSALFCQQAKTNDEVAFNAAIVLKNNDNAWKLAVDSERYDLLVDLCMSLGDWNNALINCQKGNRLRLPLVRYLNARSEEIRGNFETALKEYELSGMLDTELPRMAIAFDNLKGFIKYVEERPIKDVSQKLLRWIGNFLEAHGNIHDALRFYEFAGSFQDKIRLYCITGQWDEARKIIKTNRVKPSVLCFFARFLILKLDYLRKNDGDKSEMDKLQQEIIELFRRARQFSQAMEFAMKNDLVNEILSASFSCPVSTIIKAALWFEEKRMIKEAIIMYSRAGRVNRALGLCFSKNQYDALDEISSQLSVITDPELLITCGRFFLDSQRWSKAAECYALARRFDLVEKIINEHNVKLSTDVINELSKSDCDSQLLSQFASLCEKQNEFSVAATIYIKIKDLISAVKCLARAGDTQKVIKFAKLAKTREIYVIAANYLQTLDIHNNQSIFDLVVDMYNKANVPEKLARFYDLYAQQCAEEHMSYEKSLEFLLKAVDSMMKANENEKNSKYLTNLRNKARIMAMYIESTRHIESNPQQCLTICATLLKTQNVDELIRIDDIYIVMVQAFVSKGDMNRAYKVLEDLRMSGTDILFYLGEEEVKLIYEANGMKFETQKKKEISDDVDIIDIQDIE